MAELLRIFNRVIFFEEVAVCWMINTVARECWVATGIYLSLEYEVLFLNQRDESFL